MVPSATLKTQDGKYVIIGGNGDSVYSRLMAAIGRPEMGSQNPLYANNAARCEREEEIYEVGLLLLLWAGQETSVTGTQLPKQHGRACYLECIDCSAVRMCSLRRWLKDVRARHSPCGAQVIGAWVAERDLEEVLKVMGEARVPSGEA